MKHRRARRLVGVGLLALVGLSTSCTLAERFGTVFEAPPPTATQAEGLPSELSRLLETLDGKRVDATAFAPDGTWVLVADGHVHTSSTSPSASLVDWLEARIARGQTIGAIAFGPEPDATLGNRWIAAARGPLGSGAATNDGAYFDRKGLLARVNALAAGGIESIGVDTNGAWVLLAGGRVEMSSPLELPPEFVRLLDDVASVQRRELRQVALAYGKWHVVADNWSASSVRSPWAKEVRSRAANGARFERVVFGPGSILLARFLGTYSDDPFDDFDTDINGQIEARTIDQQLDAAGVPGLAFAVYKDGRLVVAREYGYLARSGFDRATVRSAWPLASVSKVFSGYIAARASLDREAPFDLYRTAGDATDAARNSTFDQWVSSTPNGGTVTPLALFSHTAGLDTAGYGAAGPYPANYTRTLADILTGNFNRYLPQVTGSVAVLTRGSLATPVAFLRGFSVGTRWIYSGGGFQVGQAWLEAETGDTLQGLAQRYVFEPLFMRRTTYDGQPVAAGNEPLAVCHDVADPNLMTSANQQLTFECPRGYNIAQAAGGVMSSAAELGRFVAAMSNYGRAWISYGEGDIAGAGAGRMEQALDVVALQRQFTPSSSPRTTALGVRTSCAEDSDCVTPNNPNDRCGVYPVLGGSFCTTPPLRVDTSGRPVTDNNGNVIPVNYGLGVYLSTGRPGDNGRPARFYHNGDGYGLHTRVVGYANGWAVAVLTNGDDRDPAYPPSANLLDRIVARLAQTLRFGSDCEEYRGAEVRCGGQVTSWWGRGRPIADAGAPILPLTDGGNASDASASMDGATDAGSSMDGATDAGSSMDGATDAGVSMDGATDAGVSMDGATDAGVSMDGATDAGSAADAAEGRDAGGDACSATVIESRYEWMAARAPQSMSQAAAAAYCQSSLLRGGGWRLPTPDELVLLCYARQRVGRCMEGLDDGLYWSSQIDTFDPIFGVAVDFNTRGFDCTRYVDGRTAAKLVRCVR